ncbi:MAG: N-acetylmuramoyl-L-alanine amidase [Fimbriimonadaceae bacterium]|nr:N-acetylmuramoyl-L-alanine amidase [Fimbriimonadaceae bacterium]
MRTLISLCLGMGAAVAMGQLQPAEVIYVDHERPLRAYRLEHECFLPLELLTDLGWDATLRANSVTLKIGTKTLDLPYRVFAGSQSIPLRRTLREIGAYSEWDKVGRSLRVLSVGRLATLRGKRGLAFSLPITPSMDAATPNIVQLAGARIEVPPKDLPAGLQVQQNRDGARLVIEDGNWTTVPIQERFLAFPDARRGVTPVVPNPPVIEPVRPPVEPPVEPPTDDPATALLLEPSVDIEGPSATLISLRSVTPIAQAPTLRNVDPRVFEIVFAGASVRLPDAVKLPTESVVFVRALKIGEDTVVRFGLARPMGVEVWTSADGIQIQLLKPPVGDGKVDGKLIVVDPGHGGHDSGARAGTAYEKNLALTISRALAKELEASGARVMMTRDDDRFIPLTERAELANSNRADLFISVHINSSPGGKTSGSITFFHGPSATKELLARCIQAELAKIDGIPSIGTWSDKRIYQSGFAVLRHSKMPGVLLELGFINHPRDRARMLKPDYPAAVAKAVTQGIKVFLGDAKVSY